MIELRNYSVSIAGKSIIKDINLLIDYGKSMSVIGVSGAGKSMTFRSALGLVANAQIDGEIYYKGERVKTLKDKLKNEIGYITQDVQNSLNPYIKVIDQMTSDLAFAKGISKAEAKEKALESLEAIGISKDKAKKYPDEFSGGMQQRVVIAMILNRGPELLIADEISSALDRESTDMAINMIKNHMDKNKMSLIYITHNPFDGIALTDRICVFKGGRIIENRASDEIFESEEENTKLLLDAAGKIYGKNFRD